MQSAAEFRTFFLSAIFCFSQTADLDRYLFAFSHTNSNLLPTRLARVLGKYDTIPLFPRRLSSCSRSGLPQAKSFTNLDHRLARVDYELVSLCGPRISPAWTCRCLACTILERFTMTPMDVFPAQEIWHNVPVSFGMHPCTRMPHKGHSGVCPPCCPP